MYNKENISHYLSSSMDQLERLTINQRGSEEDSLYIELKRIRDISAVFQHHELYTLSQFIMKQFKSLEDEYMIMKGQKETVYKGIENVLKVMRELNSPLIPSNSNEQLHHSESVYSIKALGNHKTRFIEKEWMRFIRFHSVFSLIYIKFHSEVTSDVIHSLYNTLRLYDEIQQWDEKSLMILLPSTDINGATFAAERIQGAISAFQATIAVIQSEALYKDASDFVSTILLSTTANQPPSLIIIPVQVQNLMNEDEGTKYKVLVVDEDLITPSLLQNHLIRSEWDVEACISPRTALDDVMEWKPDIILCETKMKELDGFTFCQQLRKIENFNQIPFIFLSNQDLKSSIIRGFQVGADDYLTKPFSVGELEVRMKRLLQRSRVQSS